MTRALLVVVCFSVFAAPPEAHEAILSAMQKVRGIPIREPTRHPAALDARVLGGCGAGTPSSFVSWRSGSGNSVSAHPENAADYVSLLRVNSESDPATVRTAVTPMVGTSDGRRRWPEIMPPHR